MAYNNTITIPAHANIYNGNNERNLRIDYAIPDYGTNKKTGIFVFVPGFGGHIDSNVYKKMRNQFADKYNVVTVQCDYFGSRFMQGATNIIFPSGIDSLSNIFSKEDFNLIKQDSNKFLEVLSKYSINLPVKASIYENENEFVDMGYMQAIDIITAIEAIKIILDENGLHYNENRVIGFGQSQGAYLLHLSNVLAPHLFSLIIDNSAWVEPAYLYSNRLLNLSLNKALLSIHFDYIAKEIIQDKASLSLHELYNKFENGSYIYSCLGITDNLVKVEDKRKALSNLNYIKFEIIDNDKVDGLIFKSTNHGLDSDFLEFVDYVLTIVPHHENKNKKLDSYEVVSSNTKINVNYSMGLPIFQLHIK